MYLTHYNTLDRAEAYLKDEGFTEVAIGLWQDDFGVQAMVTPFLANVVYVKFI